MKVNTNAYGSLKVYYHSSGSLNGSTPRYFYLDAIEHEDGQPLTTRAALLNVERLYQSVFSSKRHLVSSIKSAL